MFFYPSYATLIIPAALILIPLVAIFTYHLHKVAPLADVPKRNDTLTAQDRIFRELASLRDQVSRQAIQLDEVIRVQSITSTALRPPSDIQIRTEI